MTNFYSKPVYNYYRSRKRKGKIKLDMVKLLVYPSDSTSLL